MLVAIPAIAKSPMQNIGGIVTAVHDGDTFTLDGHQKIRVFGIDAPELNQKCRAQKGCVPCGKISRSVLSGMIAGKPLNCKVRGKSYERLVAQCEVEGLGDVGVEMLKRGEAVAYKSFLRKSDTAYLEAERSAGGSHVGIWAGSFVPPDQWRHHKMRLECER